MSKELVNHPHQDNQTGQELMCEMQNREFTPAHRITLLTSHRLLSVKKKKFGKNDGETNFPIIFKLVQEIEFFTKL